MDTSELEAGLLPIQARTHLPMHEGQLGEFLGRP
jgi:hypothetical protein